MVGLILDDRGFDEPIATHPSLISAGTTL
jgi:hypothetical protein